MRFIAYVLLLLLAGCYYPQANPTGAASDPGLTTSPPQEGQGSMDGELPTAGQGHQTWSQTGTLRTGNSVQSVDVQTGDLTDSAYAYYTVQFSVPQAPPKGFMATAIITFSVNGNSIRRQVSVGNGVEISGPADSITVRVTDNTPASFADAGVDYQVTASIAPGTRAGTTQATLTDPVTGQNGIGTFPYKFGPSAGSAPFIAIPQNAGVVGVWVQAINDRDGGGTSIDPNVAFIMESASAVVTTAFGTTDARPFYVPVPAGSTRIAVTNCDSVNSVDVSVLWVIDG